MWQTLASAAHKSEAFTFLIQDLTNAIQHLTQFVRFPDETSGAKLNGTYRFGLREMATANNDLRLWVHF
jgi:hypothetical protein